MKEEHPNRQSNGRRNQLSERKVNYHFSPNNYHIKETRVCIQRQQIILQEINRTRKMLFNILSILTHTSISIICNSWTFLESFVKILMIQIVGIPCH
jgi:hypothetical protein